MVWYVPYGKYIPQSKSHCDHNDLNNHVHFTKSKYAKKTDKQEKQSLTQIHPFEQLN